MNITYTKNGDYLLPELTLKPDWGTSLELGIYGLMRKNYLRRYRPVLFNKMVMTEELFQHLSEIDKTAMTRLELIMKEQRNPPDKEKNQMAWVRYMNNLQHQAEEIILTELIYN